MGKTKFYVVRKGHQRGIFYDWSSCEAAIKGYSGAEFKSFKTMEEAQVYMEGATMARPQPQKAPPPALATSPVPFQQQQQYQPGHGLAAAGSSIGSGGKWWAVVRGRQTGVMQGDWSEISSFVTGYKQAVYKSFRTQEEAQSYFNSCTGGGMQPPSNAHAAAPSAAPPEASGGASPGSKRHFSAMDNPPPPAFTAGQVQPPPAPAAAAAAGGAWSSQGQWQQPQPQPQPQDGSMSVTVWFDGGSRGNPGRAGYGFAIFDRKTGDRLRMGCRPLPYGSTNNEAEYGGMIAGMRYAAEVLRASHVVVKGDSQLVIRQMTGEYRVSAGRLLPLYREASQLQAVFLSCEFQHVYREDNTLADDLSNLAMDTDLVVDNIAAGKVGRGRWQHVNALTAAAAIGENTDVTTTLCTAPNFLEAAAQLLSRLWDMSQEEVAAQLIARGWTEHTGGDPVEPPAGVAGGASGRHDQGSGGGRGQMPVVVAAVTLGKQWGEEIRRQEELVQQQQRQQQGAGAQPGGGGRGAALAGGGGGSVGAHSFRMRCAVSGVGGGSHGCSGSLGGRHFGGSGSSSSQSGVLPAGLCAGAVTRGCSAASDVPGWRLREGQAGSMQGKASTRVLERARQCQGSSVSGLCAAAAVLAMRRVRLRGPAGVVVGMMQAGRSAYSRRGARESSSRPRLLGLRTC